MSKPQNFIIPMVIYPFDLMVSLNENYDQFAKAVLKKWSKTILDDFLKVDSCNRLGLTYIYTSDKHLCSMIKIENFKKDAAGIGTLTHEVFHATEFVLRKCGFVLNENSHEAYAYLNGYLMQEIYKRI